MINYEDVQRILHTRDWLRGADPEWLRENIPELHALIGREQRADYHPEGDAYTHVLQVIDQCLEMTGDPIAHFCALTHDFGKAVTIQTKPGSHYDHERLGIPLVENFCERIGAPDYVRKAAVLVCKEHLNCHRFPQMKGVKKFRFMRRIWHHVNVFTVVCKADARGRGPTHWEDEYPQAAQVWDVYRRMGRLFEGSPDDPHKEDCRCFRVFPSGDTSRGGTLEGMWGGILDHEFPRLNT
jgi:hypothetical protein